MYYQIRSTCNYGCHEGDEIECAEWKFDNLKDALDVLLNLSRDPKVIDFSKLDAMLDEWQTDPEWENDYEYGESYFGILWLYAVQVEEEGYEWRCIFRAMRDRDPDTKELFLGPIEIEDEINEDELLIYAEWRQDTNSDHLNR